MFLEECKMVKPQLLVGTRLTMSALPVRRSLRVELDLVGQLARLAHDCGSVALLQCPDGHCREQQPVGQLLEDR
eukprot:7404152-Prorocentrum_lima.AAC.1